jgi:hypothetical protein
LKDEQIEFLGSERISLIDKVDPSKCSMVLQYLQNHLKLMEKDSRCFSAKEKLSLLNFITETNNSSD